MYVKWRYRCASCALCTAVFIISLAVINNPPPSSVFLDYQETAYEVTEDRIKTAHVVRQQEATTSRKMVNEIKNVVAYSLESQLEMERKNQITCPISLKPPHQKDLKMHNTYWQIPVNSSVYLYSAFLDNRIQNHTFVRVIAMIQQTPNDSTRTYYCQVWFAETPVVVEALLVDIWFPPWDFNPQRSIVKPVLFSCEVDHRAVDLPTGVSITLNPCSKPSTFLPIKMHGNSTPATFTICVKGMDYETDVSDRLIEWFEINLLLGANKFFVYVYKVHEKVRRVLEFYAAKGFVAVVPLTLPYVTQPNDTLAEGSTFMTRLWQKRRNELIPYNDCYYRNLHASKFVIPLDIDEILLPVRRDTWREIFDDLLQTDPKIFERISSFSVKNAYFFDTFPVEPGENLHLFKHVTRSRDFSHGQENIKSFISTSSALSVFNHVTLRTLSPAFSRNMLLGTEWMQMNHYKPDCDKRLVRDCENYRKHGKRDELVFKYKKELSDRVRDAKRDVLLLTTNQNLG